MSQTTLPPAIQERMNTLSVKHKISVQEVTDELMKLYNGKFIQEDTSLPSPMDKLDYCVKVLSGKLDREVKYDPYNVIVVGIGKPMITKAGKKRADVFVAVQENDGLKLRGISWSGESVDRIKNIQPMMGYQNVKLGRFSSGEFQADDRTYFEGPMVTGMKPLDLLTQLGIRSCTIAQTIHNLAVKDNNSQYIKKTDWRAVKGMIYNYNKGPYKNGKGEYALYTITDDSLDTDFTTPEGITIPKKFTVSVDPMFMIYEKNNEVTFCGPLQVYKNTVQMEAYYLHPIHTPFGLIGGGQ